MGMVIKQTGEGERPFTLRVIGLCGTPLWSNQTLWLGLQQSQSASNWGAMRMDHFNFRHSEFLKAFSALGGVGLSV